MKKITSSVWISIVILSFIPMSWVIQYLLNTAMLANLVETVGKEVVAESFRDYDILFIVIPIAQLVTAATVIIPSIIIRKAARETSTNLSLPIGKNGKESIGKVSTSKVTTNKKQTAEEPCAG